MWLVLILSSLAIIEAGVIKDEDQEEPELAKFLFRTNGTDLWKVSCVDGTSSKILHDVIDYEVDGRNERLIWYDNATNFYHESVNAKINANDTETGTFLFNYLKMMEPFYLLSQKQIKRNSTTARFPFAYDSFTNKIYVADNRIHKIVIVDLSTRNLAFPSDWHSSLNETINKSKSISGISVFPQVGTMLFSLTYDDSTQKFFKSNMDGSSTAEHDASQKLVTAPLFVCNHRANDTGARSTKFLLPNELDYSKNPCINNAGCEHFCLLNSSGSPICACPFGRKVSSKDPKKCDLTRKKREAPVTSNENYNYTRSKTNPQEMYIFYTGSNVPSIIFGKK